MRVVVGLGNPGPRYAFTRHNMGFMVVDRLASRWRIPLDVRTPEIRAGVGRIADQVTKLVQPQLYMNMSGEALTTLPGVRGDDLVVVHDDVDLPPGRLRLRRDGGTGGHRGIASVIDYFGPDFDRVKVGIGRPSQDVDVPELVLQSMSPEELQEFDEPIERATDAVECIVLEGIERAMNRFNAHRVDPPAPSPSREEM